MNGDLQNLQNLMTAPYLKSTAPEAWYAFREDFLAFKARGGSIAIHHLILPTVLEIYYLRDPTLRQIVNFAPTAGTEPVAITAGDESEDSDASDSDSSSESDTEDMEDIPESDVRREAMLMERINIIFQPRDRRDALDRFEKIYCAKTDSTFEAVLKYVFLYQRQLENCAEMRPTTKHIVRTFVDNLEPERLRDRVRTYADRRSLQRTFAAAIEQSRLVEEAEKESRLTKPKRAESGGDSTPKSSKKCDFCGKTGHIVDQCWKKKKEKGKQGKYSVLFDVMAAENDLDIFRPVYDVNLIGRGVVKDTPALLDTGASANFISESLAKELNADLTEVKTAVRLGSGQKVQSTAIARLRIQIGRAAGSRHPMATETTFVVLKNVRNDVVLGFPFLQRLTYV